MITILYGYYGKKEFLSQFGDVKYISEAQYDNDIRQQAIDWCYGYAYFEVEHGRDVIVNPVYSEDSARYYELANTFGVEITEFYLDNISFNHAEFIKMLYGKKG